MAGILDNKSRMIDTIITQEGRRQIAAGDLRISFVSFTDADTFYEGDVLSGSSDPSDRIFLEASNMPHDQITFEADDSGKLMPFRGAGLDVIDGKVLSGSSDRFLEVVTGSQFASTADLLLDASVDNFKKLYAIRNDDVLFGADDEFLVDLTDVRFTITDTLPFKEGQLNRAKVDRIESLFQDRRLSHLPNFKYLPPVNRTTRATPGGTPLGSYPPIGQRTTEYTYDDLVADLGARESRTIEFSHTSTPNNIFAQMFEKRQDGLRKLDVIDFGEVATDDPQFPTKHIFFVGKVYVDGFGAQTFVNIFTLVFEG